ncbi:MAG: JAB domain-containing protein [Nitrospira sp.]|nr:JAB domain-containing protein [Nitrospira sp.]
MGFRTSLATNLTTGVCPFGLHSPVRLGCPQPSVLVRASIVRNERKRGTFHSHPSTDPTPSPEERTLTTRLREAGDLLGIRLLDHLFLGDDL